MQENIYTLFRSHFPADRSRTFLETGDGRRYSYADLEHASAGYAAFFAQLGVTPGERIAVQVEKSPQALFLYLACLRAGLIYVPLNPAYRRAELDYLLRDAAPAVMIGQTRNLALLTDLVAAHAIRHLFTLEADGGGTLNLACSAAPVDFVEHVPAHGTGAVILYTSGTTGQPKGALLTHANLAANACALHQAWDFRPDDVLLHALPLFHIHGLFVACHCVLLSGSKMLFLPKFDAAEVTRWLPDATVFMGVPTYYTRLLALPGFGAENCKNMRLFTCGSAPLLTQTFEEFHRRTGHEILERYGMSETGMNTSNPLAGPRRPGTVGPPLPGVAVRITSEHGAELPVGEVGALEVTGPNVFSGYWRKPELSAAEFTADGWFKTGDLARRDADGYIAIAGRAKDLIISGGLNIYPKEIESCIDALEGIAETAVIGVPHADFGEAAVAIVVRHPGGEAIPEMAILAALKNTIANYKVPKRIFFVDALPRNAMGKVQKNQLRITYADQCRLV